MSKFKVGDRVTLKKAVDVHIDGGLTQIVPGEIGRIDWTDGNEMDVYFGDYVKLELYASQVKLAEPTDRKTAFLAELKELLAKYNAELTWRVGARMGNKIILAQPSIEVNTPTWSFSFEREGELTITADNIMDYDKKEV